MTDQRRLACLFTILLMGAPAAFSAVPGNACHGEFTIKSKSDAADIAYQTLEPVKTNGRAVVVVHGSGASSRANPWYGRLSETLLQQGYLVALPDKRGSERSGGNWTTASFETLAGDTVAVIEDVSARCAIATGHLGIVGVSQGGQVAAIVAQRTPRLGFVVNLVGSTTPLHDALRYEERSNLIKRGLPKWLARPTAAISAWTLRTLRQRAFWRAVGNFDPASYWKDVEVPSRIVLAEHDTLTPTEASAQIIRSLGNPNVKVEVIPGVSHDLLIDTESGTSRMHPRVLQIVDEVAQIR